MPYANSKMLKKLEQMSKHCEEILYASQSRKNCDIKFMQQIQSLQMAVLHLAHCYKNKIEADVIDENFFYKLKNIPQ